MERSADTGSDLRSDADLVVASRSGDAGAFGALYQRHAGAALVVARQYVSVPSEAEDVVSEAFAAVWSALQGGSGPTDAFRAYLFTVVRRAAAVQRQKGRRAEPTDDVAVLESGSMQQPAAEEPALEGFERSIVARAFASLPERWQAVLWHSEIEGKTPAEVAPLLGLSANSAAALAYRAREGLRQAYLQQHLSDDMPDACRAVAGKLGGYVRGGLGTRDTAQVEAHLDGCGDCRAMVLELRDVNHGLRAAVAPLVLGVTGLGALRFVLPTSGGLAAGAASLASGGAAGGTGAAGAGAASGSAGAGAAGTAGTGAAAAGGATAGAAAGSAAVGAAAGATAAGGATAGGLVGAITGFLAGVPTALVAGIAGVVVVAGITAGAVAIANGNDEPVSASQTTGDVTPAPTAAASVSPTARPDGEPAGALGATGGPSDVDALAETPAADPSGSSPSGRHGSSGSAASSADTDPSGGTPSPEPTPTSTATPTQPTTPVTGTPRLAVIEPPGGLALAAGQTGQTLAVDVTNTGDAAATDVVAQVSLPEGVQVESVSGRFAVRFDAAGWDCAIATGGATCTLPVLDAGQQTHLSIQVGVDEGFDGDSSEVTWQVRADGLADAVSYPSRVTVIPAPARLTLASPLDELALRRGSATTLSIPLRNAGGVAAEPAAVTVGVPQGVSVTGLPDDGWTCAPSGRQLLCALPELAARAPTTLNLQVSADEGATDGRIVLTLAPGGPQPSSAATIGYTVTDPPPVAPVLGLELKVDTDGTVTATVGVDAATASDVTLVVDLPQGLSFSTASWPPACDVAASRLTATCDLGRMAAGGRTTLRLPADVQAAISGVVHGAATAPGATPVSATAAVGTTSSGLGVRYQARGSYDVAEIGAPVLGCPKGRSCQSSNNNDVAMAPLDAAAPPAGSRAGTTVPVSSSSTVALPTGARVAFAGLYWSGDKVAADTWSTSLDRARLRGPGGGYQDVTASSSWTATDNSQRTYYQSFADVTQQVAALGAGTWSVADIAVSATRDDRDATYYGGWGLVVVYEQDGAAAATVTVYDGAAWVGVDRPEPEFRFVTTPDSTVRVGVVAWEGDYGTTGDRLLLDGKPLVGLRSSGTGSSNNAFDSTATGWGSSNSLGVDVKGFQPAGSGGDVGTLQATTTGDQYLLGAVTVRITG